MSIVENRHIFPPTIRGRGNFSVRGSGPKIFLGGCGGIQMFEVLSVREIFFCFVFFLKIIIGIYKFQLHGDMGRDA